MDGQAVGEWKRGPQPYEGVLSVLCSEFGGLPGPGSLQDQDWPTMRAMLDYRMAQSAVDAFNDLKHGAETLTRNPAMGEILRDMVMAQTGADAADAGMMLAAMQGQIQAERDADDEG